MKKILSSLIIILFFISCEESFNPNTEYVESYAVNALLRGDQNKQTITIVKSINPNEYQSGNRSTQFVDNAVIKITSEGRIYDFKDSVLIDGNNQNIYYYFVDGLNIAEDKTYNLEVNLPNGKTLTSTTYSPRFFTFENGASTTVADPTANFGISVHWRISAQNIFFHPQFYINYSILENGIEKFARIEVPNSYITKDGKMEGKYPEPSTLKTFSVDYSTFSITLQQLMDLVGDPKNIKIYNAELVLKVFDENLTKYYSSTNLIANAFSSRIYGSDYSNINGGLGVFATYMVHKYGMLISEDYIKSFGYSFVEN